MPGPLPITPTRVPPRPSIPTRSLRAVRASPASLSSLAFLAAFSLLAAPCAAAPGAGDFVPAAAARSRPDRWVPDAPAPGGLLWIERHLGPAAGAENLLFAHGAFSRIENRLLPTRLFEEENLFTRLLSIAYRLGKYTYLDWPAAAYLDVAQHELFGHGYRARAAGYEDIRFEVAMPPPYGRGDGLTVYSYPAGYRPGMDENLSMAMAGIEAEDILAQKQRNRFLREGSMDYHGSLLYLAASMGLSDYVAATDTVDINSSNDLSKWLYFANWKAGRVLGVDSWISLSDLKEGSRLAYADPFFWYAAWTAGRYLWNGSMRWRQPMIPLGPVRWLPSLGYRLSPFGGQYLAENLLTLGPRAATLRAVWGGGGLGSSWGADAEAQNLVRWHGWSLDAALRAWGQPPLRPDVRDPRPPEAREFGAGLSAAAVSPALFPRFPLRAAAGFSTKRAGYVPGESLEADFALRVGVGLYR